MKIPRKVKPKYSIKNAEIDAAKILELTKRPVVRFWLEGEELIEGKDFTVDYEKGQIRLFEAAAKMMKKKLGGILATD